MSRSMDVTLGAGIDPGTTHQERLDVTRRIAASCLEKHGDAVAAICIYGTTAVDMDLPYSDLDMTILTRVDLDAETRGYTYGGLTINLDYQTLEDTIREEIDVPGEGGCWTTARVLYDPDGVVEELKARYARLEDEDYLRRFASRMADPLPTAIGKVRNGVIAGDRPHFLGALHDFGTDVCKALCLLNREYVTGQRAMLGACRGFGDLPEAFPRHIDAVLGQVPASDQDRYEAAEALWQGMQDLAAAHGVKWRASSLGP